ncbi:MAG: HAD family phosphatase [Candidatus Hydrogenedentes bacterium]|nr:HAD family phosphatase [Candidatus Hydrogenedentota bacterium]
MPYALIFDVDGVIADTEPLSTRASSRAFYDLHGVTVKEKDHLAYMGTTAIKHAEGIAAQYGLAIDTGELVAAHRDNFLQELEGAGDLVFPGVLEIFAAIAKYSEWHIALATSSGRERSEAIIRAAGIDEACLSAWITGDDVRNPKPDPEIYRAVASELGLFPRQCVVIEDSVAGTEAAKAASMHCIAVTNTFPGEHLRQADRIVDSLEEVTVTMLYDLVADPSS